MHTEDKILCRTDYYTSYLIHYIIWDLEIEDQPIERIVTIRSNKYYI